MEIAFKRKETVLCRERGEAKRGEAGGMFKTTWGHGLD